jgi:PAS domain S-box-containing protein
MTLFQQKSLRFKIIALVAVALGVALCIAGSTLILTDYLLMKREVVTQACIQADIVGNNSTAAIMFHDAGAAHESLISLSSTPDIVAARIHVAGEEVLAEYGDVSLFNLVDLEHREPSNTFVENTLFVTRPIVLERETIGYICLAHNMDSLSRALLRKAGVIAGILITALSLSTLLAFRFQRSIIRPIRSLATIAGHVSTQNDYAVRAEVMGNDEVGQLTRVFNTMLEQIQERDTQLEAARSELERRVENRTAELVEANRSMQLEIRERRRAEDQMREAQSLLMAYIEQTPAGIIIADAPSGAIRMVNATALDIGGLRKSDVLGECTDDHPRTWNVTHPDGRPCDPADLPLTRAITTGEECDPQEFIIHKPNGDARWINAHAAPVKDAQGLTTAGVVVFVDITNQKHAENERAEMQRKLLETSRLAGMAEVATGVLHNVGNVLNSINVSSTLLISKVQKSAVADVARIAALLAEHEGDLGRYITEDARGRLIPKYLAELSEQVNQERDEVLDELNSLSSRVEHIKEIVSMQQSYSKVSGTHERINIIELLDDAIRINTAGLERHGVSLQCEFDEHLPEIVTDRHKVLQILVNLISNAKYALDAGRDSNKRLILRVHYRPDEPMPIVIQVDDNGVGITRDNLTKIFSHGFTTRKHGHGFGLHSGALSAQLLGGTLTADSQGPGTGAVFTLCLPDSAPREAA